MRKERVDGNARNGSLGAITLLYDPDTIDHEVGAKSAQYPLQCVEIRDVHVFNDLPTCEQSDRLVKWQTATSLNRAGDTIETHYLKQCLIDLVPKHPLTAKNQNSHVCSTSILVRKTCSWRAGSTEATGPTQKAWAKAEFSVPQASNGWLRPDGLMYRERISSVPYRSIRSRDRKSVV